MDARTIVNKAGGARKVAERLGLSVQAVYKWERIPPKHLPKLQYLTGLSQQEMRPDLYEHEKQA